MNDRRCADSRCGRRLQSQPDAADASTSFSYITRSRTDVDATLRVTVDADGRTLTHPSKVTFSMQR